MFILAVDPGVQTGVAYLNPEGDIVWTLTCESPYEELDSALTEYVRVRGLPGLDPQRCDLAAEVAPSTRHYQDVHSEVSNLFAGMTVHWIRPSEWKNHPFCSVPVSDFDTKHEAEAVGIGRAHLLRRRRSQLAEQNKLKEDVERPGPDREHQKSS